MGDDCCGLLCLDLPVAERLRNSKPAPGRADALAAAAAALADPTRVTIIDALARGGELCVCDLSWLAERSEKLVSHHVRRLRGDGLVTSRRDGKMVMYALTPRGRALYAAVTAALDDARIGA